MFRQRRGRASHPAWLWVAVLMAPILFAGGFARAGDDVAASPTEELPPLEAPEVFPDFGAGDELLLFEDIPIVTAAARRRQRVDWASAAMSVVTAEDIHFSGLENLAEVLQFQPGIDFMPTGMSSTAVGVRGFHEAFTDRLLLLVDGRNANDPGMGSPFFEWLPLFPEDVERIEIVRGPAGGLWGANAFTGLINIVTKDPEDTIGWLVTTRVDHFGDVWTRARWGGREEDLAWRVSLGYQELVPSDEALGEDDFSSNDFARAWTFDAKLVHRADHGDRLTVGLGHHRREMGANLPEIAPAQDGHVHLTRAVLRFDMEGAEGTSGHLQWYLNSTDWKDSREFVVEAVETDLEAQFNFDLDDHELSVGGNLRADHFSSPNDGREPELFNLLDGPYHELRAGLFVADRYYLDEDLILEAQLRGDWYSETTLDWSGRLTVLLAVDERQDHVFRLGLARAFRTPQSLLNRVEARFLELPSPPLPPGTYGLEFRSPEDDLDHETTWSIEAGYTGHPDDDLTLVANAYYQRFDDLVGFRTLEDPLSLERPIFAAVQQDGADSYGIEIEAMLRGEGWRLGAWYAFNDVRIDERDQTVRAYLPALHKVGITCRLTLVDRWTLNVNYRFSSEVDGGHLGLQSGAVDPSSSFEEDVDDDHRLDVAVTGRPWDSLELTLGVEDVLDRGSPAVQTIRLTGHETPGRTFFLRLQLNF